MAAAFKFFSEPVEVELPKVDSFANWVASGSASLKVRLQYVDRHQDVFAYDRGAQAAAVGTRFSFASGEWNYLSFFVSALDVRALPDDDNYFDGSNGQTDDLFVAAAQGAGVEEAWLNADVLNTRVRYGRQGVTLDKGRLIGGDDWELRSQRFSGTTLRNNSLNVTRIRAGHLNQLNRGVAPDEPERLQVIDAKYLHLEYLGFIHSSLSVYYLDLDGGDRQRWNTRTHGIRFAGEIDSDFVLSYRLEYGAQASASTNPVEYRENYYAFELGGGLPVFSMVGGQAKLGGRDDKYFVLPLSDKRAYQGWSNQFANQGNGNVNGGVVDRYLKVASKFGEELSFEFNYHRFSPDSASGITQDWGAEWGFGVRHHVGGLDFSLLFARFEGDALQYDERSLWLSLAYVFK